MKNKHIRMRIAQCVELAKISNCPRLKVGAMLIDPERNVVLMDGYNGGPRGGSKLCGPSFCLRDGLHSGDVVVEPDKEDSRVIVKGVWWPHEDGSPLMQGQEAKAYRQRLLEEYAPIPSGQRVEIGCHHAELNVIANAAAGGVKTIGAWMICTAEPCMLCAKLIHHAGIKKLIVIEGGYIGGRAGVEYLQKHGVEVRWEEGPKDPRTEE